MTTVIETFTRREVEAMFRISPRKLNELIRAGKVGYFLAKNRQRCFYPEHVDQVKAALEVKATALPTEALPTIGMTPRAAAIRRRRGQG